MTDREQAIEVAAYRKAAEMLKQGPCPYAENHERSLLALITPSAQSALDEMIADREKRARETALRQSGDWFLNWCDRVGVKVEESNIRQGMAALLDAPGAPSLRLYTEAEVTERVREEAEACAQILDNGRFLTGDSNEKKWAVQVAGLIRKRATAGAPVPESVQGKSEGKK